MRQVRLVTFPFPLLVCLFCYTIIVFFFSFYEHHPAVSRSELIFGCLFLFSMMHQHTV